MSSQVAHTAQAYPRFRSIKQVGVFLLQSFLEKTLKIILGSEKTGNLVEVALSRNPY